MTRSPRMGICVYCGVHGEVTKDHVPPKCLFPPEARINLITVYACSACHESYKLDDEYFRVILALRDDLPDGFEAQFLRSQTQKTLNNQGALNFRQSIMRSVCKLRSLSPNETSEINVLKIDVPRLKRTTNRIVRGLFAKFFGIPLPNSYELTVNLLDLQRDMGALNSPEVQELAGLLQQYGKKRSFGKVLDIWYAPMDDDPYSSLWVISLHEVFIFIGFTVPANI